MSNTELPEGWEWKKLGEVCNKIMYGLTASAKKKEMPFCLVTLKK